MRDFRTLTVWQKSHELTREVYRASRSFPAAETYGLTSQLRRAAVSISANVAEGCGRGSGSDFARFAQIAMGSASEVESLLLLAPELAYVEQPAHAELEGRVTEVKRMLTALIRKLRAEDRPANAGSSRQLTADG